MRPGTERMAPTTDEELMARYARGDLAAFREIYARYERRVFNYLLKGFVGRETAADLVQETFLRLHRARRGYRPGSALRPWLYAIATNLLRSERRRSVPRPGVEAWGGPDFPTAIDLGPDPERQLHRARLHSALRAAVADLPDSQREVIVLSRFDRLRHDEIARALGVSVGAVKLRIFRGMERLREKLSAWVGEEP